MKYIFLLLALLLGATAKSQPYVVQGRLIDTINNNHLPHASVVLVRAADSMMVNYTRANEQGQFSLTTDTLGRYILLATFPGFADFVDVVNVQKSITQMGTIPMMTKEHVLSEFVLKSKRGAIQIKGDTMEYAADSFYVKDGATVEDLLKKLPGLEVDKSGNITAHGEQVQKIFVDGEEFFSDDPAVVTKSLQARTVESVQVFDKKSDQAALTGVDDGVREKTINLKLKENMKRGAFGKAQGGAGTRETFDNQLMVNAFKSKRKISVFGIHSTTGSNGLSWEDRDKFGGGNDMQMTDEGYFMSSSESDEGDLNIGNFGGGTNGLPKVFTGGLHYSNKWNENKHAFNTNYRGANQSVYKTSQTINQYLLPEQQGYTNTQDAQSTTNNQRHRVDFRYELKPDSTTDIKITGNAGMYERQVDVKKKSLSVNEMNDTLNSGDQYNSTETKGQSLNTSLFAVKRFKKKGRSASLQLNQWYSNTNTDGLQKTNNTFQKNDSVAYTQSIDQLKDNNNNSLNLAARISYTEPLTKVFFLETNYKIASNQNTYNNLSYNKNNGGEYTQFDSTFSNKLQYNTLTHSGGAGLRFTDKIWNIYAGMQASYSKWHQDDLLRNFSRERSFPNFFPQANIIYKPNQMRRVSLQYNGSTSQPSINQIAPLVQNTDPLNIAIGNPNLNQQFRHSIGLNANDYKIMTNTWKYAGLNFSLTDNAISRSESINEYGARTYQYINVDGIYNASLWCGMGSKIRKWEGYNWNFNFSGNTYRGVSFVNQQKNISNNYSVGGSVTLRKEKEDKYDIYYNPEARYNYNKSTISTLVQQYWTMEHTVGIDLELPGKVDFETNVNYYWRERTAQFPDNNNLVYWNASLIKKFLKNDDLRVGITANDILNQNKGFSRYANDNIITQNTNNTLQRYVMLTAVWNFRWTPKGATTTDENNIQLGEIIK